MQFLLWHRQPHPITSQQIIPILIEITALAWHLQPEHRLPLSHPQLVKKIAHPSHYRRSLPSPSTLDRTRIYNSQRTTSCVSLTLGRKRIDGRARSRSSVTHPGRLMPRARASPWFMRAAVARNGSGEGGDTDTERDREREGEYTCRTWILRVMGVRRWRGRGDDEEVGESGWW